MPTYVSSLAGNTRHAAYAIEQTPPAVITAIGTGVSCIVEQFPCGPSQTLTSPTSTKDLYNFVAPAGMSHTGSGYQALIRKGFAQVPKFVRVVASSATVAASYILLTGGAVQVATINAKWVGTAGNAITATVSTATDGNANHFNLTIAVTGASGTTTEVYTNLDYEVAAGNNLLADLSKSVLIGSIVKNTGGVPAQGTFSLASGADVSVASSDYVGTQGNGDKGVARCEGDNTIRHIFAGDPGNTFRAAVNAGFQAHAGFMGDRAVYLNGNSGNTLAQAATDVANYRSARVVYCDPWVYILDDVTGAKTLVPSASFAAAVATQLSPSTSIAWKNAEVIQMLGGINDLESDRGQGAGSNTVQGIATFIREQSGGFTIEAGVVTIAATDITRKNLTRTRMGDYIAVSFVNSVRSLVDAPNVPLNQQIIVNALETFMAGLKRAAKVDPNHSPHVLDYQIGNLGSVNTAASLAAGQLIVPLQVQTSSAMEQIYLSIQYGEGIVVQHQS